MLNQTPVPEEASTLFLGDLSVFCTEKDIRKLFRPFGPIEAIRVKRGSSNKTNLSYGFIKFTLPESAEQAMKQLNGVMFLGRGLRIGWAEGKNPNNKIHIQREDKKITSAQVHVSFISKQVDVLISEATLRGLFGLYGEVTDVALKKSQFDRNLKIQNGYGFVHYPLTQEGIRSAITAVHSLHQVTIDRVTYDCSVSHALEDLLGPTTVEDHPGAIPLNDHGFCLPLTVTPILPATASPQLPLSLPAQQQRNGQMLEQPRQIRNYNTNNNPNHHLHYNNNGNAPQFSNQQNNNNAGNITHNNAGNQQYAAYAGFNNAPGVNLAQLGIPPGSYFIDAPMINPAAYQSVGNPYPNFPKNNQMMYSAARPPLPPTAIYAATPIMFTDPTRMATGFAPPPPPPPLPLPTTQSMSSLYPAIPNIPSGDPYEALIAATERLSMNTTPGNENQENYKRGPMPGNTPAMYVGMGSPPFNPMPGSMAMNGMNGYTIPNSLNTSSPTEVNDGKNNNNYYF